MTVLGWPSSSLLLGSGDQHLANRERKLIAFRPRAICRPINNGKKAKECTISRGVTFASRSIIFDNCAPSVVTFTYSSKHRALLQKAYRRWTPNKMLMMLLIDQPHDGYGSQRDRASPLSCACLRHSPSRLDSVCSGATKKLSADAFCPNA